MDEVNAALTQQAGPYFLDDFSLVDCVFAPFLERIGAHHQLFDVEKGCCCMLFSELHLASELIW